jgi:beta-galactosidase
MDKVILRWNSMLKDKNMHAGTYSRYEKERLFFKNPLTAEKGTSQLPYSARQLRAVRVEKENEKKTSIFRTSGETTDISLQTDRRIVVANGHDLPYVTVQLTVAIGNIQPNATNRLNFRIEGPGIIAGVNNGDLKDINSCRRNTRKASLGGALVVIRSTQDDGGIKLIVVSAGLTATTTSIRTASTKPK